MFQTLLLPQVNTILIMDKPPLMSSFGIKEKRHTFALSSAVCESHRRFFYPLNFMCFGAKMRNYTQYTGFLPKLLHCHQLCIILVSRFSWLEKRLSSFVNSLTIAMATTFNFLSDLTTEHEDWIIRARVTRK
ncbi:hypothetical protein LguiA_011150 [Lonicera macranthoides]